MQLGTFPLINKKMEAEEVNWGFYAVAAVELMLYIDMDEQKKASLDKKKAPIRKENRILGSMC